MGSGLESESEPDLTKSNVKIATFLNCRNFIDPDQTKTRAKFSIMEDVSRVKLSEALR